MSHQEVALAELLEAAKAVQHSMAWAYRGERKAALERLYAAVKQAEEK